MAKLPLPVRRVLSESPDELAVERVWRRLQQPPPRRRPRLWLVPAAACLVLLLGLGLWLGRTVEPSPSPSAPAPLALADGRPLTSAEPLASGSIPRTALLSDGSSIALAADTLLDVLESTGERLRLGLRRGQATFDVQPQRARRWSIETSLATVEVVGTRFKVVSAPGLMRVEVERGVVLVTGEQVPDRARRLEAGMALELPPAPPGAPAAPPPPAPAPPAPSSPGWRQLAERGDFAGAYRALGPSGLRREAALASPEQLFLLADVARTTGHAALAVEPLRQLVERFPEDPRASLAAFSLGRLQLEPLRAPKEAALAFERCLSLRPPPALVEAAHARLVEARARAGDLPGAREARDEYLRRFPDGAQRAEVERWLEVAPDASVP